MLSKSLFKISYVSAGNIINAGLGFLFFSAVAKTLNVEQFGRYALLTSLLVSLSKIMDFGTNSFFVARSISKDENDQNIFFSLKILLFIITVLISWLALTVLKLNDIKTVLIFIAGLTGYGINTTLFSLFQKLEKFHIAISLNTIPAIIKATFALAVFGRIMYFTFEQLFSIFSLSMLSCSILSLFLPKFIYKFELNFRNIRNLIYKTAPAGISILINEGWPAIMNSLIKFSKTFSDVGIFSLANKIANVFSLISLSIFTVLLPKNAKRKRDNIGYDFAETIILSVLIILFSFVVIFIAKMFVLRVLGQKFEGSLGLLDILIFSSAFSAIHVFLENYFFVEEKTKMLLLINGLKLAVFLLLVPFFILLLSLKGVAYAQLAASITALITTIFAVFLSANRS